MITRYRRKNWSWLALSPADRRWEVIASIALPIYLILLYFLTYALME